MRTLTRHADASERSSLVETGAFVLARVRVALVDVDLAPRSREASRAVASERAWRVDAEPVVLAWRSRFALVNVFRAIDALVAVGTRAHVRAVDRTRIANGARVTRVRSACVVQMA